MDVKRISEVLRELFKRYPQFERLRIPSLSSLWREAVGDVIAEKTKVIDFKNGILYVSCKDSLWLNELHFRKGKIIEKINETVGENLVKDVVFKTR